MIQWSRVLLLVDVANTAFGGRVDTILLGPSPDIFLSGLEVNYDVSRQLTVNGTAEAFTDFSNGTGLYPITAGTFHLDANIDSNGLASSAHFLVSGQIFDDLGSPLYSPSSGSLLSGDLLTFQFDPGPFDTGELMFSFGTLTGDLAPLFHEIAILKMNLNSAFPGTFEADFFSADLANVGDIGMSEVPEPGPWSLVLPGSVLLFWMKRRRDRAAVADLRR
jgi:hypothetical protein